MGNSMLCVEGLSLQRGQKACRVEELWAESQDLFQSLFIMEGKQLILDEMGFPDQIW